MANKIWVGTTTAGDWSVAGNWSPSGVPASADNVYLQNSSQGVTAGFDQAAIVLASLNIAQSYTGAFTDYLNIGAALVRIGYNDGPTASLAGSTAIMLDLDDTVDTTTAVTIENSGQSATVGIPTIRIKELPDASSTVSVRKGSVGVGFDTGDITTLGSVNITSVDNPRADAKVYIGSGVTLTTLNKQGGDCVLGCAATTVTNTEGTLKTVGSGAITTMHADGGNITSNSTGTITTLNADGGVTDFLKSSAARTVTTINVNGVGQVKLDPNVVTVTNAIASTDGITIKAA